MEFADFEFYTWYMVPKTGDQKSGLAYFMISNCADVPGYLHGLWRHEEIFSKSPEICSI